MVSSNMFVFNRETQTLTPTVLTVAMTDRVRGPLEHMALPPSGDVVWAAVTLGPVRACRHRDVAGA